MRKLWVTAVAGLALAGFGVAAAEASVVKTNITTTVPDKPVKKKPLAQKKKLVPERRPLAEKKKLLPERRTLAEKKKLLPERRTMVRGRVCENFFQCLFGRSRVTARGSMGVGVGDRVTRTTVSWGEGKYKPGSIIIRTPERSLYYVLPGGKALRYRVGVGRDGFQWGGKSRIVMKREWPDWRPPKVMIEREAKQGHIIPEYMAGGPNNPLGARAMYIGGTMFRIHGTNNAASIGGAVSSGCIRMMNSDVIDLYGRVAVGSPVYVYQ